MTLALENKLISGAQVMKDLHAFRAANADWAILLRQTDTLIGSHTVGKLTQALREGEFPGWELFVPADERDDEPPSTFSELAKAHFGDEMPEWTPDPNRKVVFSSSLKVDLRNFEGKARREFKRARPVVTTGEDPVADYIAETIGDLDVSDDALTDDDGEPLSYPEATPLKPAPEKQPVKKDFHAAATEKKKPSAKFKNKFSREKILASMRATKRKTKTFIFKGLIEYGPLANGKRKWGGLGVKLINELKAHLALTDEEICTSAAMTYKATRKRKLAGVVKYGPAADTVTTWDDIRRDVKKTPGKNLSVLLESNNVLPLPLFTRAELIETLLNTRKGSGEWPAEKASIKYPPLKGRIKKWKTVDNSMRYERNGITKAELPYDTWRELMIEEGHMKPVHFTVPLITASAFATWLHSIDDENPEGRWPARKDGIIKHGPLADGKTTWAEVEDAIVGKRYGLTEANCPYSKSLHELLVGEGFVIEPVQLTVKLIEDSVLATFHATNGRWPTLEDGMILHGPLAHMATWRQVNEAIKNKHRGITASDCRYKSLSKFIKNRCQKLLFATVAATAKPEMAPTKG
jgi:hypothetical protein